MKIKASLCLVLFFLICFGRPTLNAQSWQWTKRVGTQYLSDSHTDNAGNTFLTGKINGTHVVGTTTLTGTHGNAYVTKIDSNGTVIWAVEPGNSTNILDGVAVSADPLGGGCYLLGIINGTSTAVVGSFTFSPNPGSNFTYFLSKLDGSGNVIWATKLGNAYQVNTYAEAERGDVKCDAMGNVYLTGSFTNTLTLGSQTLVASPGNAEMFVAKFDAGGNVLWVKKAWSNETMQGISLAVDQSNNCYVTGYYYSTNPITAHFGNLSFTSSGSQGGIYIAKYDASGAEQFAVNGKEGNPRGIAVDNSGNTYITGIFTGTLNVQGTTITSYTNASFTSNDPFVAKFSPSGQIVYLRHGGSGQGGNTGTVNELGSAIVAFPDHQAMATGDFYTTGVFGSLSVVSNTSSTTPNAFMIKYSASGTENMLTKNGSSSSSTRAMGLGVDANQNIYVAGTHIGTGNFGSQSLTYNVDSCVYLTRVNNIINPTSVVSSIAQVQGNNPMCPGSLATFSASVINGGSNPIYQWYVNGSPVGTNTPTYSGTAFTNNSSIYCQITSNMPGATNNPAFSEAITINVNNIPVTISSPTVCFGGTVTLNPSVQYAPVSYSWSNGATSNSISVSPTVTTVYSTTLTFPGGCTKTASSTVSVTPAGTLSISAPSGTLCPKVNLTLTGSGSASTYTWVNGPTTATYNTQTPTVTTTYTLNGKNTNGCLFTGIKTIPIFTSTPITANTSSTTICRGQTVSLTATGAPSYTYSGFGTGSISINPTSTTIYSVATKDNNNCFIRDTVQVNVDNSAIFFVSPSQSTVCASNNQIITATSNPTISYVWMPGNLTGTIVTVAPMANTVYTVTGTSGTCSYVNTATVTTKPSATLSVVSNGTLTCASQPTLYASSSPSVTYQWYYKNGATLYSAGSTASTAVAYLAFPYYCYATYTVNSCVTTFSLLPPINNSNPVVTYTAPSICSGNSGQISINGAASYNLNYTGVTSNSVFVVSPTVTTTYTLVSTGSNSCSSVSYPQLIVNQNPIITVTAPSSICAGSSANLIANGVNTYSWSTGANTSSINVIPLANETFSVTGTDNNNCNSTQTVSIAFDNTCQNVWPGDANSDGTSNNLDILELGLHYTQTGSARSSISNTWQSYHSNNWAGTISNGKNMNHSDCNGDGVINNGDTLAIYNNYNLTHNFKINNTATTDPQLNIVPDQSTLLPGAWGSSSIFLGEATNSITNINGCAFTANFDNTLIEQDSIYIEYVNSFIDASNQNLKFRKLNFVNGQIYTATTHTNNLNASGYGLIAKLYYKIKYPLTQTYTLQIGLNDANKSDNAGVITPLTTGSGTIAIVDLATGIDQLTNNGSMLMFPNPAGNILNIKSSNDIDKIQISNLTGQVIITEAKISKEHKLNLENISNGVYFLKVIYTDKQSESRKLIISK